MKDIFELKDEKDLKEDPHFIKTNSLLRPYYSILSTDICSYALKNNIALGKGKNEIADLFSESALIYNKCIGYDDVESHNNSISVYLELKKKFEDYVASHEFAI